MTFDLLLGGTLQQVRDLNDRLMKQQRIIDQLHEEIKKLKNAEGTGGCEHAIIIQRVSVI